MENRTLRDLTVPMAALRVLAVDFADLPAPAVRISAIWPNRLELSLHNGLGPFETWRAALGIAAEYVEFHEQGEDDRTWVLQAFGTFAGAELHLIGYGASLASVRAEVAAA